MIQTSGAAWKEQDLGEEVEELCDKSVERTQSRVTLVFADCVDFQRTPSWTICRTVVHVIQNVWRKVPESGARSVAWYLTT